MIIKPVQQENYLLANLNVKEANLAISELFKSELIGLVNDGHKLIVVNFEKVKYVDSSFLGALVAALKAAIQQKSEIALLNLNTDIRNMFELIRMDKVFKIYDHIEQVV
jgi:anti-sigma B factor antagonist